MNIDNLKKLGWDEFFESHFQPYAANGYACGRVASEYKHSYGVFSESGKVLGELAGRLRPAQNVQLSRAILAIRMEPADPAGEYKVRAKVSDLNAGITFELETKFRLK